MALIRASHTTHTVDAQSSPAPHYPVGSCILTPHLLTPVYTLGIAFLQANQAGRLGKMAQLSAGDLVFLRGDVRPAQRRIERS
jgi:hypothetical protein